MKVSAGLQLQRTKTAVLYHVREHSEYTEEIRRREEALTRGERKFEQLLRVQCETLALVRSSDAVVRDLVERTMSAAEELAWKACWFQRCCGEQPVARDVRSVVESRWRRGVFPEPGASTDNPDDRGAAYSRFAPALSRTQPSTPIPASPSPKEADSWRQCCVGGVSFANQVRFRKPSLSQASLQVWFLRARFWTQRRMSGYSTPWR